MSTWFESFISVFEDYTWRGTDVKTLYPIHIDSENLSVGKQIIDNSNNLKAGRVAGTGGYVSGPIKPEGGFKFAPRFDNLIHILYSHFQCVYEVGTEYFLAPNKYQPKFGDSGDTTEGYYGAYPSDVYSLSFLKKYFDTSENGGTNSIIFSHGICDNITFDMTVGEDLFVSCNYKFRDCSVGTAVSDLPDGTSIGSYSSLNPIEWFEGTFLFDGLSINVNSIKINSKNNLEENGRIGRMNPDRFIFRQYELSGEIELDFPKDGFLSVGSMLEMKPFEFHGTYYQGTEKYMIFQLPCCLRKEYDVPFKKNLETKIPFVALENNGTSPITIILSTGVTIDILPDMIDAGDGSRVISEYEMYDAGDGARIISEYTMIDRLL